MKVLFSLILVVILASCGSSMSPARQDPGKAGLGSPETKGNFIIDEKLVRTESQFLLWKILY